MFSVGKSQRSVVVAMKSTIDDLPKPILACGAVVCLLLRWCVSLYPYSGQRKPPMFGDYEAQRHWQEITLHIPVDRWYRNTTQNDLQYWGLDYPPLTAYHSLVVGYFAEIIDPESVVLFASRGYESEFHKLFMRWTVFLADFYCYFPAIVTYFFLNYRLKMKEIKAHKMSTGTRNAFFLPGVACCIALAFPGLILIDYGHFQYNCVSLGFLVHATVWILHDYDTIAAFFFVLALNYKQMELYHALPFFFYMLRKCIPDNADKIKPSLRYFIKISLTVLATFAAIWFPFLGSFDLTTQVVSRLFPFARGVFEDKVANVWCFINVFIKLKTIFDNATMAKVCLVITGLAVLPSSLDLFFRPNVNKFVLALINSSLSFFLFSFQVHEKSILLVAIPVLLRLPLDPIPCLWFLMTASFSMLPLLQKDQLIPCYLSLSVIYVILFMAVLMMIDKHASYFDIFNITKAYNILKGTKNEYDAAFYRIFNLLYAGSSIGMIVLTSALIFIQPPPRYPDLFPLLISVFSCCIFVLFYLYFNYCQFIIPSSRTLVKKVAKK